MESLGAYLKKERESKGVTLEEIANSTHISKKFLKAIELDDFASLPNQTVARGFLRAYARCICIDSNEVMNAYTENIKDLEQKGPINTIFLKEKSKFKPLMVAGGILVAIVIFVFLTLTDNTAKKNVERSDKQEKEITVTPPTKKEDTGSNVKENVLPENQNAPVTTLQDETSPLLTNEKSVQSDPAIVTTVLSKTEEVKPEIVSDKVSQDELFLTIVAKEQSWLNVVIDDVEIKDAILRPGEKIKWKATKSFLFSSGNKKGLDVFLQGYLVIFPEPQDRIIKNFMIDRSLLKKETPPQPQ